MALGMAAAYDGSMEHNPDRLHQLGAEMKRIRTREKVIRPELHDLIRAADAAGMPQVDIVDETGYTRDQVRQICLPPERKRSRAKATPDAAPAPQSAP